MPESPKEQKEIQKIAWGTSVKNKKNTKAEEEQKKHLYLQLSEISIILDTYDDIFSDFDPRPYSVRALSDDFLSEMKKATKEKEIEDFELLFMIPKNKQNTEQEKIVRKRLHEYFKKHYHLQKSENQAVFQLALFLTSLGVLVMFLSTYISSLESTAMLMNFLLVILEPTGWFMTWYGLEQVFYKVPQKKEEIQFYEKMTKCKISFVQY